MASKYWIKLYHEILDDPKMGLLPDDVWRLAIELMLLAGEVDDGGNISDLQQIAWRLRKQCNETLQKQLQALQDCNILFQKEDKTFLVVSFAERQKAVSGAERVRQHRKRAKKQQKEGVTKRYTDIDIDTDGDKENEPGPLTSELLKICNQDYEFVLRDNGLKKQLASTVALLAKINATPKDLQEFDTWRRSNHWTGKSSPTLKQVGEFWGEYAASKNGQTPAKLTPEAAAKKYDFEFSLGA